MIVVNPFAKTVHFMLTFRLIVAKDVICGIAAMMVVELFNSVTSAILFFAKTALT